MSGDPAPNPAVDFLPSAPRCWVRRYLANEDAFLLARLDGEDDAFIAVIDRESPGRARARDILMDALFGQRRSFAPLQLLVREKKSPPSPDGETADARRLLITDVFSCRPIKDNDARKILDSTGQLVSRWSDGLEDAVDHHGRLSLARSAIDYFTDLNPTTFAEVRARATAALPDSPAADLPRNLLGALQGGEGAHTRRYNPSVPLRLQLKGEAHESQRVNYAVQRALIEDFADRMTAGVSALAFAQSALLASGVLLVVHPARSDDVLRNYTRESARGIGAQTLAGLMDLNGAAPATRDFDELWAPTTDGSLARRQTLHEEIMNELAPHPIATSPNLDQKTRAYLELAASRLARYDIEAHALVFNEQMKTAGAKKPKHPGASTASPAEALAEDPGPSGSRMIAVLQAGSPAAAATDHATHTIAQSETIPWF